MIGGYIAKKGLKKVKDKVKGNKKSIGIEEENDSDDLLGLGNESDGSNENEGSNNDVNEEPEDRSTDSPEDDENSDEEKSAKGDKGSKGGTPSTMSIAKVVFKSGLIIGICIVVLCIVMSIITMFTTTTGTAVQIIDGSILTYGESTPDPNKKDGKGGNSDVNFDGDELYTKAKMIVDYINKNPGKKSKVNNIKVPSGVPSIVRNFGGKRFTIYNIIEAEYIMREATKTDYLKEFTCGGVKIPNTGIDFIMWSGTCQENTCMSSYEEYWGENKSWSEAHIIKASGGTPGPFQFSSWYFASNAYTFFVTSLENPNLGEYGRAGHRDKMKKTDLKYNSSDRFGANESSAMVNGRNVHWQFSDIAATSINRYSEVFKGYAEEYIKVLKNNNIAITETNCRALTGAFWDSSQRGHAFTCYHAKSSGKKMSSSSGVTAATVLEMVAQGEIDNIDKWLPNINTSDFSTWFADFEKKDGLLDRLKKNEKLGSGIDFKARFQDKSDPTMSASWSKYDTKERKMGVIHKIVMSYAIEKEIRALVNSSFDSLGLKLPSSGGSLELKESKGEFQAYWTNKNGKTLSSEQMKSYNAGAYSKQYLEHIGTKEKVSLSDTGKYKTDGFSKLFSDGIGIIHYRQGINGDPSYNNLPQNPNATSKSFSSSFCGGFSTSMVLSTLLHKYVHPCEVAYAMNTYNQRHGTSYSMFYGGICPTTSQELLINEQKIDGKQLFKAEGGNSISQSKLDSCLKNGGMAIACVAPASGLTGYGHFIVIREKTSNGKYLIANSTSNEGVTVKKRDHEFNLASLYCKESQVCYITPTSYYKTYIDSANTSQSSSNTNYSGYSGKSKYASKLIKSVFPNGVSSTSEKAVAEALSWVSYGKYLYGGSNPSTGIDCTHFVAWCYKNAGKSIGYKSSSDVASSGYSEAVKNNISTSDKSKWKPGDILARNGHVAIYCGKVNGTHMMVDASTDSKPVTKDVTLPVEKMGTQIDFHPVSDFGTPARVIRISK